MIRSITQTPLPVYWPNELLNITTLVWGFLPAYLYCARRVSRSEYWVTRSTRIRFYHPLLPGSMMSPAAIRTRFLLEARRSCYSSDASCFLPHSARRPKLKTLFPSGNAKTEHSPRAGFQNFLPMSRVSIALRASLRVCPAGRLPSPLLSTKRQNRPHSTMKAARAENPGLPGLQGDESAALARISAARVSCKSFLKTSIPSDVVKSMLEKVIRVPTSFNTQPYRLVLVSSDQAKGDVSACMAEINRPKVYIMTPVWPCLCLYMSIMQAIGHTYAGGIALIRRGAYCIPKRSLTCCADVFWYQPCFQVQNAALTVVVLADLEPDVDAAGELLKESAPRMSAYADMLRTLLPIYAGESGKNTIIEASSHPSIIIASSVHHVSSLADI